jgi:GTPase
VSNSIPSPSTASTHPTALVVGVRLAGVSEREHTASLAELTRLVTTLGYRVVGSLSQNREALAPHAILGEGKLEELKQRVFGETPDEAATFRWNPLKPEAEPDPDPEDPPEPVIDLVAVDHEVSAGQLRNLEQALGTDVLDRTGVIIEIFHRHAKSRQAKLQVEIARLTYAAPRLRQSPRGKEKQRGRGAGEAGLELDRRKIRDRIAELREELALVQEEQLVRRAQRQGTRRVALVGYTNAGKSSLMRSLTGSEVYVEDKLFATLDTTVRALQPEAKPRILISDTVGFIKKLPHDLVASFKSTLDEALEASLILHVVDASDDDYLSQLEVTREVLAEIGATEVATQLVLNKTDRLNSSQLEALQQKYPGAWFLSAKRREDVADLRLKLVQHFDAQYSEACLVLPYSEQRLLSEMHEQGRVVDQRYEQDGVTVLFRAPEAIIQAFRARLGRAQE